MTLASHRPCDAPHGLVVATAQSISHVWLFVTPRTAASLSSTIPPSLCKLMSTESMMPSNHFILCHPLLFLPSICPNIRVFSNESAFWPLSRWPKYWSFSIGPSNEYSGFLSGGQKQKKHSYLALESGHLRSFPGSINSIKLLYPTSHRVPKKYAEIPSEISWKVFTPPILRWWSNFQKRFGRSISRTQKEIVSNS